MDPNENRPRRNTHNVPYNPSSNTPQTPPLNPNASDSPGRSQQFTPTNYQSTTPNTSSAGRLRALTELGSRWSPSAGSGPSYSPLNPHDLDMQEEESPTRRSIPMYGNPPLQQQSIPGVPSRRPVPQTLGMGIHLQIPQAPNAPSNESPNHSPVDATGFQAAMAGIPGMMEFPGMGAHVQSHSRATSNSSTGEVQFTPAETPRERRNDPMSAAAPAITLSMMDNNSYSRPPLHTRQTSTPSIMTDRSIDGETGMLDVPLGDDTTLSLTSNAALPAGRTSVSSANSPSAPRPSVSFGPGPLPRLSTRMLGDDLRAEEGSLSPGGSRMTRSPSTRSLSPGSPLERSKNILRQMSQRIVNLSNEQDVVERAIRRPSVKEKDDKSGSDIELTSIPPMPGFGGDGLDDGPEDGLRRQFSAESEHISPLKRQISPRWGAPNPFKGKSLGMFPPESRFRMRFCDLLVHPWTEPTIFFLIVIQTILLAVDCYRPVKYDDPASLRFGSPIDYCLVILFSIYTVELMVRMIVSGFIMNPTEYSTLNRDLGWRAAVVEKINQLFGSPHARSTATTLSNSRRPTGQVQPSLLRSLTIPVDVSMMGDSRMSQRARLAHRAFLRHSFNRLDFIAVVSFWISFFLQWFAFETGKHIAVFRMLSCLRIMRLLYLTSGTTVILRSLKKAAPLLLNVGFLIGFFWLLFAIIGVQSFKSSLRRQCVWIDPTNSNNNWTNSFAFCGGYLDPDTYLPRPWVTQLSNGSLVPGTSSHKGYLCPVQSVCLETTNPYNGSMSFDNIANSLELVFVIMSSNTFSDQLYYLTNSDYLAAAIFFAVGIVILFFWLVNLLIAVITSSFQVIREESKTSAFTGEEADTVKVEEPDEKMSPRRKRSSLKFYFNKTEKLWALIILYGLIAQCFRSAAMGPNRARFVSVSETVVTLLLLVEIILRFVVDWRHFFKSKRNLVDLAIAIITTVIQLPPIHRSGTPYAWLTFFQIIRIYRVVLAVPITRDLIMVMLGNFTGLLNLLLFVVLFTFLAAILATQMFRGSLPDQDSNGNAIKTHFKTLWNSFLGMYQIFSSENWTNIMYNVQNYDMKYNTAWVGAAFFILWFILANFIVLNMFIAVIQENFDVSEDEKRLQQVKAFLEQRDTNDGAASGHGNLALANIFRYGMISGRRQDPNAYGSGATEMLLRDAVVRDFLDHNDDPTAVVSPGMDEFGQDQRARPMSLRPAPSAMVRNGTISSIWTTFVGRLTNPEPNPFYSRIDFNKTTAEEVDPRSVAQHVGQTLNMRRQAQREYLRRHPMYNVSLYIFHQDSKVRRLCQRIVGPGRGGDRIGGLQPSIPVWYAFSAFIYMAIVAMVILACVTTPLYQREFFRGDYTQPYNWFVWTDLGFAVLFTIEAVIKVIADGFFWTPHAYFRSTWGFIDGMVLITLWINVTSALYSASEVSRAVGAFKALRALRLLNISDSARENFHSVIIRGGVKILSAAFVSLSLLIPFAVYGLNLFSNKMNICNDGGNIDNLNDCVGEYATSNPFNWNVYSPRVVKNPYFSFDDFGSSLFILFQIVSQEGWIDAMWSAQSITGVFRQPQPFASTGNAVFFVIFNLLGAVFVLTLFVSVFMRNYTEMTGVAFLTADQRSWLELRKLLRQISPSKRRVNAEKQGKFSKTIYRWAVTKTGAWQRFVTGVLIFHLVLLCVEFYPSKAWWDKTRGMSLSLYGNRAMLTAVDLIFLAFTMVYIVNIIIRISGMGWARFRRSSWDLFSIFSVFGTLISTLLSLARPDNTIFARIQKLFLVSIALLLIPRNNQLDQLFKTAAASLPLIVNLLATWFVLFLVFAIALTQAFSLTRFGANETDNINLRNVPKAMILLFRTSVGEGWNQLMEDFATIRPPFCVEGNIFTSDCGSGPWARFLFIAWNILSMYIFVNLFVSLIYESFSYVYQQSSGLSVISREEIRRFKEAWAVVDPDGSGYITKEALPKLLRELSGVFEMRIYDGDYTVKRLINDCAKHDRVSTFSTLSLDQEHKVREIDLKKLNERLASLPVHEIRRRRARLQQFYEEVLVSSERDRGVAFNTLLMILAHYKVINDSRSLRLNEFLRRRARLQRVDEAVRRQIVIGFFDTCYWRRYFRRHQNMQQAGRMQTIPQLMVPEIYVEDQDFVEGDARAGGDPDTTGFGGLISGASTPRSSEGGLHTPRDSIQISPANTPPHVTPMGRLSPQNGPTSISPPGSGGWAPRRPSFDVPHLDLSGTEPGEGGLNAPASRSRANSNVSVQGVLEALDQSAWGESIRRSFSVRRQSLSVDESSRRGRGRGHRRNESVEEEGAADAGADRRV